MQVQNGKAPMPSFEGVLEDEELDAVANYVLVTAEKGWE